MLAADNVMFSSSCPTSYYDLQPGWEGMNWSKPVKAQSYLEIAEKIISYGQLCHSVLKMNIGLCAVHGCSQVLADAKLGPKSIS